MIESRPARVSQGAPGTLCHLHLASGLDEALPAVGTLGEANTEVIKRVLAFQIGNPEVEECRQKVETAWRVHKRPTAPVRLLDPGKHPWTEFTLQTAATALDERFTTKLADGVV